MSQRLAQSSRGRGRHLFDRTASLLRGVRQRPGKESSDATVSVIVAACDDEADFLDEALDGILAEQHTALEVLVVPHGASGRVPPLAGRHAAADQRVRLLDPVDGDGTAAFDLGARLAGGRYLAFVKASDVLPVGGLRQLVRSLEETGSDFAIGRLAEDNLIVDVAQVARRVPLPPTQRAGLAELPRAIAETHPGNRLIRTDFWRSAGLVFHAPEPRPHGDPLVEAYLRASAFDVVTGVTYHSMNRGLGIPVGHQRDYMADLAGWLRRQRATVELLRGAEAAVRRSWVAAVLDGDVTRFCEDAERADDEQWDALRSHVRTLLEFGGDGVSRLASADASVRTWLLLDDRRAALERLCSLRRFANGHRPTELRDGRVFAELPFFGEDDPGVPDECYEMSAEETRLTAELWGARWTPAGELELTLFTFVNFVDYEGVAPDVSVSLVEDNGPVSLALPVVQVDNFFANATVAHRFQDYTPGGCRVTVDAEALVRESASLRAQGVVDPRWRLSVRVSTRGLTRAGTISLRRAAGDRGRPGHLLARTAGGGWSAGHRRAGPPHRPAHHDCGPVGGGPWCGVGRGP